MISSPVRTIVRTGGAVAFGAAATWVGRAAWGLPVALGATATQLRAVAQGSPQFSDGKFVNVEPSPLTAMDGASIMRAWLARDDRGRPAGPVPLATSESVPEQAAQLAATWYGHASVIVEVDGRACCSIRSGAIAFRRHPRPVHGGCIRRRCG